MKFGSVPGRVALLAAICSGTCAQAQPLTSGFVYQGELRDDGVLVSDDIDCRFRLFAQAVGGVQVGPTFDAFNVAVKNGVFTVDDVDFGASAYDGGQRWVQIEIRNPAGAGAYTVVSPRQPLRAAPYANQLRGVFVDAANNVGVGGTTTPAARLHVGGTSPDVLVQDSGYGVHIVADNVQTFNIMDSAGMESAYFFHSTDTDGGQVVLDRAGTLITGIGAANQGGSGLGIFRDDEFMSTNVEIFADIDANNTNGSAQGRVLIRGSGASNGGLIDIQNSSGISTVVGQGGPTGGGGRLDIFHSSNPTAFVHLGATDVRGGRITLNNPTGNDFFLVEPDFSVGGGAYMQWNSNETTAGVVLDGNAGGTENPSFSMFGIGGIFSVSLANTGNSSVSMPNNAVSSAEMFDEPGIAAARGSGFVPNDGTPTDILSRTITVPASGHVVVLGGGEVAMTHINGASSSVALGVSDVSGAFPNNNQDVEFSLPSNAPTGIYDDIAMVHGIFTVGLGSHTFYLVADNFAGDPNAVINDAHLTLMYFPTAYGTVTPDLPPPGAPGPDDVPMPALTAAQIEAEKIQSITDELLRREREMDAMMAEFARMQERIAVLEAEQSAGRTPATRPEPAPAGTLGSSD